MKKKTSNTVDSWRWTGGYHWLPSAQSQKIKDKKKKEKKDKKRKR